MCVCPVGFFQTVTKSAKKTRIPSALQSIDLNEFFFVKQPFRKDTDFELQPYWCTGRLFCLLSQAPERIPYVAKFSQPKNFAHRFQEGGAEIFAKAALIHCIIL